MKDFVLKNEGIKDIRGVVINDKEKHFVLNDLREALGFSKNSKRVRNGVDTNHIFYDRVKTSGGVQNLKTVDGYGAIQLIECSDSDNKELFRDVFSMYIDESIKDVYVDKRRVLLIPFAFDDFHISACVIDGEYYFIAKDVADTLKYSNTRDAIARHVNAKDKGYINNVVRYDGSVNPSKVVIINESGLYSLIMSSKMPSAEKFKHWVTSDVLPTLRKTGSYVIKRDEHKIDIGNRLDELTKESNLMKQQLSVMAEVFKTTGNFVNLVNDKFKECDDKILDVEKKVDSILNIKMSELSKFIPETNESSKVHLLTINKEHNIKFSIINNNLYLNIDDTSKYAGYKNNQYSRLMKKCAINKVPTNYIKFIIDDSINSAEITMATLQYAHSSLLADMLKNSNKPKGTKFGNFISKNVSMFLNNTDFNIDEILLDMSLNDATTNTVSDKERNKEKAAKALNAIKLIKRMLADRSNTWKDVAKSAIERVSTICNINKQFAYTAVYSHINKTFNTDIEKEVDEARHNYERYGFNVKNRNKINKLSIIDSKEEYRKEFIDFIIKGLKKYADEIAA